jgi:hypothetical protein
MACEMAPEIRTNGPGESAADAASTNPAAVEGATPTIVVACLATAMLMLDISVINTALSNIAHGLDTGLSGLQWVVDAYTIPLAATVLTAESSSSSAWQCSQ